jgi:hypothetical protein
MKATASHVFIKQASDLNARILFRHSRVKAPINAAADGGIQTAVRKWLQGFHCKDRLVARSHGPPLGIAR